MSRAALVAIGQATWERMAAAVRTAEAMNRSTRSMRRPLAAGGKVKILAMIDSSAEVTGGTYQWKYTLKRAKRTDVGYDAVEVIESGDAAETFTECYNRCEECNHLATGDTVPYGNGYYPDDLAGSPSGELLAIPNNTVVELEVETVQVDNVWKTQYWFGLPNPVFPKYSVVPAGTNDGDMLYWSLAQWVVLAAPSGAAVLMHDGTAPYWATAAEFACPD